MHGSTPKLLRRGRRFPGDVVAGAVKLRTPRQRPDNASAVDGLDHLREDFLRGEQLPVGQEVARGTVPSLIGLREMADEPLPAVEQPLVME
jgi:hypothetical protein